MVGSLWTTAWIVLLCIGLVVWTLIIWTVIVYRRRKGQTGVPPQLRYNMPIEIFYTIVPFVLVIGFFAFTAKDMNAIETPYAHPDEQIHVFAKQWSWDFEYTDQNTYDPGIQAQASTTPGAPAGSVVESEIPTLYLPVDKSVTITLDSRDVVHSFWVPAFLFKLDVIPGHTNHMYLTPERIGTYVGKCAELCGEYHSAMLFNVKVVSEADFQAHMSELRAKGYVGKFGPDYDRNNNLSGTSVPQDNG